MIGARGWYWHLLRTVVLLSSWQSLLQLTCATRYPDTHALPAGSTVSSPLFVHRQWKVNPDSGLLTVLVPVFPTEFELGNLRNQLRTAAKYFDINTVKEYILTAPWEKVSTLQEFVDKEWATEFPKYHTAARVVSDGECAAQLQQGTIYDTDRVKYPGWVKQQLVSTHTAEGSGSVRCPRDSGAGYALHICCPVCLPSTPGPLKPARLHESDLWPGSCLL